MLAYDLNEPIRGATHCAVTERLDDAVAGKIRLAYTLGTVDEDGGFVADPLLREGVREIAGGEYDEFHARAQYLGAPAGDYRAGDLVYWCRNYGLVNPSWVPGSFVAPAEEDEATGPEPTEDI